MSSFREIESIKKVKKWFYVIENIFRHILAKLKINPRSGFLANSQKPRNDVKFASDVNIFNTNERFSRKRGKN